MRSVSILDVTTDCQPGVTAGLDGVVTVTLDDAVATFHDLGDGEHLLGVSEEDAAYSIEAVVACDTDAPSVSVRVTGVGAAPMPGDDTSVTSADPAAAGEWSTAVSASAQGPSVLPSTGLATGALPGAGMVLLVAGVLLTRLARRVA